MRDSFVYYMLAFDIVDDKAMVRGRTVATKWQSGRVWYIMVLIESVEATSANPIQNKNAKLDAREELVIISY